MSQAELVHALFELQVKIKSIRLAIPDGVDNKRDTDALHRVNSRLLDAEIAIARYLKS